MSCACSRECSCVCLRECMHVCTSVEECLCQCAHVRVCACPCAYVGDYLFALRASEISLLLCVRNRAGRHVSVFVCSLSVYVQNVCCSIFLSRRACESVLVKDFGLRKARTRTGPLRNVLAASCAEDTRAVQIWIHFLILCIRDDCQASAHMGPSPECASSVLQQGHIRSMQSRRYLCDR